MIDSERVGYGDVRTTGIASDEGLEINNTAFWGTRNNVPCVPNRSRPWSMAMAHVGDQTPGQRGWVAENASTQMQTQSIPDAWE